MGDKVALPSLSLPKQRTHWSVGVVIAASVLFLIMCGAVYAVMQRQQAAEEAFARRQANHEALIKAETEKAKAEAERAVAEAKKKEAEAAAAAAAAAAQKKPTPSASVDSSKTKHRYRRSSSKGSKGGSTSSPSPSPAAPSKPATKASKDIDDLLRSFK
jgi:regulator of protease activity HflC (stomatin/prohibitin superfamily)